MPVLYGPVVVVGVIARGVWSAQATRRAAVARTAKPFIDHRIGIVSSVGDFRAHDV